MTVFSHSAQFSRFIHVGMCIRVSLIFLAQESAVARLRPISFPHSSADGHVDSSHVPSIIETTTLDVYVQVFAGTSVCSSSGNSHRSGISERYGSCVLKTF